MKFRFAVFAALSFSSLLASHAKAAPIDANAAADLLRGAADGDVALMKSAIKRGAPLEIRDGQYLFTPLGWAAWKGQLKAVNFLLDAGANTEAHSSGGALMPVTVNFMGEMTHGTEFSDQTPLTLAIMGNTPQEEAVVRTLLAHKAKPNTMNSAEMSPFLFAVTMGSPKEVALLLSRGGDPNIRGAKGVISPLVGAVIRVEGEASNIVKMLLDAGANPNDTFVRAPLNVVARKLKRVRSAELIEAAQKKKLQRQIETAKKPAILYPESNSVPTFLE